MQSELIRKAFKDHRESGAPLSLEVKKAVEETISALDRGALRVCEKQGSAYHTQ